MVAALRDPDEAIEKFWRFLGYAARYGHQPILNMIGPVSLQRLASFNDGVEHWIKEENKSGRSNTMTGG